MKRDFTKLLDITRKECDHLLKRAKRIKELRRKGKPYQPLAGKNLAMIFEKASTRTRLSFEAGMHELGGYAIFLSPAETQIGRGEPVQDTARVMSRYVHGIMVRTFSQTIVDDLAKWATIPVINGLSDQLHPCQILADLFTIGEYKGDLGNVKIAYIGDGNNVANSWLEAAILLKMPFSIATPKGYLPDRELVRMASENPDFVLTDDPTEAVRDADVIYTDVWVSMGQEKEKVSRKKAFKGYKIDDTLLKAAHREAIVMHCLPAYRGQEITGEVFEQFSDVIFTQAENRLHVQKALLEWLLKGPADALAE
ncbi:MAG: argF [Deltaproteobacteria bacterium]|nr:argF [Deltaproteobacteria bacterium]